MKHPGDTCPDDDPCDARRRRGEPEPEDGVDDADELQRHDGAQAGPAISERGVVEEEHGQAVGGECDLWARERLCRAASYDGRWHLTPTSLDAVVQLEPGK